MRPATGAKPQPLRWCRRAAIPREQVRTAGEPGFGHELKSGTDQVGGGRQVRRYAVPPRTTPIGVSQVLGAVEQVLAWARNTPPQNRSRNVAAASSHIALLAERVRTGTPSAPV